MNFSKQCFTEEPGCTVLKNSTNALVTNQTNADTSLHPGLVALIACVLTALILLLVVLVVRLRFCRGRNQNGNGTSKTIAKDKKVDIDSDPLLNPEENTSIDLSKQDIKPRDIKGHISHLYLSTTGKIWASNDRGKVGVINPSGNDKRPIETCSTYSGHFTLATVDDKEEEHIYWVHNEKSVVKRDDKDIQLQDTGIWEPISILFSAKESLFYVGLVMNNDAKIARYNKDWSKKDDIHRYIAEKNEGRNIFRYPAYLVENINGNLCVSDNNKRVIGVDTCNDNKIRFTYTGDGHKGFTPYGISTDSAGRIFIVDSTKSCIHIINQKGKFQRYIKMSEHLREPRGLCIDKSGKCYVGTYGTILVYNYKSDDRQTTTSKIEESEK